MRVGRADGSASDHFCSDEVVHGLGVLEKGPHRRRSWPRRRSDGSHRSSSPYPDRSRPWPVTVRTTARTFNFPSLKRPKKPRRQRWRVRRDALMAASHRLGGEDLFCSCDAVAGASALAQRIASACQLAGCANANRRRGDRIAVHRPRLRTIGADPASPDPIIAGAARLLPGRKIRNTLPVRRDVSAFPWENVAHQGLSEFSR